MTGGGAQHVLSVRHRDIVDDLGALAGDQRPCYPSASAFRFVYEPDVGRDLIDCSALAQHHELLIENMTDGVEVIVGPLPGGGPDNAVDADPGRMFDVPATTAGLEKAEQGCRALANGWYREAEELFLACARLIPTEPAVWLGAGLAAAGARANGAADHLGRATRYLIGSDPAGAAYVAILAAALHERDGDRRQARQFLIDVAAELPLPCPALSLHLARLGPDRAAHLDRALAVDPMLEPDIEALRLGPEADLVTVHRLRTEREISELQFAIGELRKVDGGPTWPDPPRAVGRSVDRDRFVLCEGELALAAKVDSYRQAQAGAGAVVAERAEVRRQREDVWRLRADQATAVIDHQTVIPAVVTSFALAVGLVVLALVARLGARAAPGFASVLRLLLWLALAGVVAVAGWIFVSTAWPHRTFRQAQAARDEMPKLWFEATTLREEEFETRRRFNRARQDAEVRMGRVTQQREAVLPRPPAFLHRPAVPAADRHRAAVS